MCNDLKIRQTLVRGCIFVLIEMRILLGKAPISGGVHSEIGGEGG